MESIEIKDRVTFLAEQFDVFKCDDSENIETKLKLLTDKSFKSRIIKTDLGGIIAILSEKNNNKGRQIKKISVCLDVFSDMIAADPMDVKFIFTFIKRR
jgi:hypothetical protein